MAWTWWGGGVAEDTKSQRALPEKEQARNQEAAQVSEPGPELFLLRRGRKETASPHGQEKHGEAAERLVWATLRERAVQLLCRGPSWAPAPASALPGGLRGAGLRLQGGWEVGLGKDAGQAAYLTGAVRTAWGTRPQAQPHR